MVSTPVVVDTMFRYSEAASRRPSPIPLISLRELGAGEGIRTLDPNLGKGWARPLLCRNWLDISLRNSAILQC
jgi:hypothetical protein